MLSARELEAYRQATTITCLACRFNFVRYLTLRVGDATIALRDLLQALGFTPEQVSFIFADHAKNTSSYDGLGAMFGNDAFALLATLLGKRLDVYQTDGASESDGAFGVWPLPAPAAAQTAARWTKTVLEREHQLGTIG